MRAAGGRQWRQIAEVSAGLVRAGSDRFGQERVDLTLDSDGASVSATATYFISSSLFPFGRLDMAHLSRSSSDLRLFG